MNNFEIFNKEIREQFPYYTKEKKVKQIYFDNASTTQKPINVLNIINEYYLNYNSNPGRGLYTDAFETVNKIEKARDVVSKFINAKSSNQIFFNYGTTDGINMVAQSFISNLINENDEILVTEMEHTVNILPWMRIAQEKKAKLKFIKVDKNGEIDFESLKNLLNIRTKFLAITHISNTLGCENDIEKVVNYSKKFNVKVLVDSAQGVALTNIDVQKMGCDFLVFSGHKLYAPTGVGVLYIKDVKEFKFTPYRLGGGMIKDMNEKSYELFDFPAILETGSVNTIGILGLMEAIYFIEQNKNEIHSYVEYLTNYTLEKLKTLDFIKIMGNPKKRIGIITFAVDKIHSHDVSSYLNGFNISIRVGHHCNIILHKKMNFENTCRVSFSAYNNVEEIDVFFEKIKEIKRYFNAK